MNKEIKLSDWERILVGEAPMEFLIEVLIRTVLIYGLLLVIMRLLGKRMSGQLTQTEMAVMVTLGAIIAPATQLPDRGIVQSAFVLVLILFLFRYINLLGVRNPRVENLTQGQESLLIRDGILQLDELAKTRISHQQVLGALRNRNIFNLGQVSRLYLEPSGDFSLYTAPEPRSGLSTLPPADDEMKSWPAQAVGEVACSNCGQTSSESNTACPVCGEQKWVEAIQ